MLAGFVFGRKEPLVSSNSSFTIVDNPSTWDPVEAVHLVSITTVKVVRACANASAI
jgi:hypothetical protein